MAVLRRNRPRTGGNAIGAVQDPAGGGRLGTLRRAGTAACASLLAASSLAVTSLAVSAVGAGPAAASIGGQVAFAVTNYSAPSLVQGLTVNSGNDDLYSTSAAAQNLLNTTSPAGSFVTSTTVGSYPVGAVYDPGNGDVYVANMDAGTVSVIDPGNGSTVATITVGGTPTSIAYDASNGFVFVGDTSASEITGIDPATNTVFVQVPLGIGEPDADYVAAGDGELYVADSSEVAFVSDDEAPGVSATGTLYSGGDGLALDPATGDAWMTTGSGVTLLGHSNSTIETLGSISVPSGAGGAIAVNPTNQYVYVASGGSASELDGAAGPSATVIGTQALPSGAAANAVAVDPTSGAAWVSDQGTSQFSQISVPPGAPSGLTATAGSGQVTLSWTAPTASGGQPVSAYEVYDGTSAGGESATPVATVSSASTIITGLTDGTTYYFLVTASNAAGHGPSGNEASATPAGTPSAPSITQAVANDGQVTLVWSTPSDGGSPITGYKIFDATSAGGENYSSPVATPSGSTNNDTITGLTDGTTYYFTIEAQNAGGTSPPSPEVSATPEPTQVPGTPGFSTSPSVATGQINLFWYPGNGVDITSYQLYGGTTSPATVSPSDLIESVSPSTTSDTLNGLNPGETYYFALTASNSVGASAPATLSVVPIGPPQAPGTPVATTTYDAATETGNVTLNWAAAGDDGSPIETYLIYEVDPSGSPVYNLIAASGGTSWNSAGYGLTLTAGNTYSFAVAAENEAGTGPYSGVAAATFPPVAPTGLTASTADGKVTLDWTAPSGDAPITGYEVYAGTSSGGETPYSSISGAATSATLSGLSSGTTYYFTVAAIDSGGTGPESSEVSLTTPVPPGAPGTLSSVAGVGQVTLSWGAPAASGSSPVTGYDIFENGSSTPESFVPVTSLGPSPSSIVGGLTNGTGYTFTVAAVSNAGTGAPSNSVSATPITVPGAPTGLTATASTGQVDLSWTAPTANGGSPILGYDVFEGTAPGEESSAAVLTMVGATSATVTTLTNGKTPLSNGTAYYFTVQTVNAAGTSASSNEVSAAPNGPPAAPRLSLVSSGNGQVSFSWTPPTSNGGSALTGYELFEGTASGQESASPVLSPGVGASTATVTGLSNGTTYYFTLAATNLAGAGSASNEVSATPRTVPGAPSGLTATPGNGEVSLSWSAPASNGGSAITGYDVFEGQSEGGESPVPAAVVGAGTTSSSFTGVTNGTTLFFTVVAVNVAGAGAPTAEIAATPSAVPGVPGLYLHSVGSGQVTLLWSVPVASSISGYDLYEGTKSGGESATPVLVASAATTSATISGLSNGTTYYFTVAVAGSTTVSNEVRATPSAASTPPGAPTNLAATAADGQVILSWVPPAASGSSSVSGYEVFEGASPGAESSYASGYAPPGSSPSYTVTGLTNGTTYYFTVGALNAAGTGTRSGEASSTPITVPGAPTGVLATAGAKAVALSWGAPASNGGSPVTGYEVFEGTKSGGESSTPLAAASSATSYTATGLTNGTTYYFTVVALNSAGSGATSSEVSATPAQVSVTVPTLTATSGASVDSVESVPDSAVPAAAITGASGTSNEGGSDAASVPIDSIGLGATGIGGLGATGIGGLGATGIGGLGATGIGGLGATGIGGLGATGIGTLPLTQIASLAPAIPSTAPSSSEPTGLVAAGEALNDIPLSELSIVYPAGCTTSCTGWAGVLQNSDLANLPLQSVTLGQVLTDDSVSPTPAQNLASADLDDFDVGGSPLGSIPVAAFALGSTPISEIPLPGTTIPVGTSQQQAEIDALDGWCTALADLATSDPSSSSAYTCANFGIQQLPGSSEYNPATASSVNLFTLTLAGIGLGATGIGGLGATGIGGLGATGIGSVGSTPLSEIDLASAGSALDEIPASSLDLSDNAIGSIPLQAITSLTSGNPLGSVTIGSIGLGATGIGGLGATGIGGLGATGIGGLGATGIGGLANLPLDSIGLGATGIGGLGATGIGGLGQVPLDTIESLDFSSVPLSELPLSTVPLGQIPLSDINLSGTSIGAIPLDSLPLASLPAGSIGSIGLGATGIGGLGATGIGGLVNCAAINCSSSSTLTLADAEEAGEISSGATLGALEQAIGSGSSAFADTTLDQLGSYGSATLGDLLAAVSSGASVDVSNTVLGELGVYGSITLGQLVGAIDTDISSGNYSGVTLTALQDSLEETLAQVGFYGSATLGELLSALSSSTPGYVCTSGETVGVNCPSVEQILEGDNTTLTGYPALTLDDLLLSLMPATSYPWQTIDLAEVPLASSASAGGVASFSAPIDVSGASGVVDVSVQLPSGFAYDPSSATIDGAAAPSPTAGTSAGSLSWALPLTTGDHTFTFEAAAGSGLGTATTTISAAMSGFPAGAAPASASVQVVDGLEPDDTLSTATSLSTGTLNIGYITSPTDVDDWSVTVAQGQELALSLSNLPADYDLELFAPDAADDNGPLQGQPTGDALSVSDSLPSLDPANTVESVPGSSDIPINPPPGYELDALSSDSATAADYTDDEGAQYLQTPPLNAGTYIVQVSGYNGATSQQPYLLQAALLGGGTTVTCQATQYPYDSAATPEQSFQPALPVPTVPSGASGPNTLYLIDTQRMEAAYGSAGLQSVLTALQGALEVPAAGVSGVIVPVDAYSAVEAAYAAWDADPCSVAAANAVVAAIDAVVDTIRASDTNVQNVVVVGADAQIPFARLVDGTVESNERDYAAITFNGASDAEADALEQGYYLSDDPFGATPSSSVAIGGETLYLPTAAVGRLIETPAEIAGALNRFDSPSVNGVINATSGLATGYSFMATGAELASVNLADNGLAMSDLINNTWSESTLQSDLDQGSGVVALNGHFDYSRALSANGSTNDVPTDLFTPTGVYSDESAYAGRLLFSMGCHAGLDIDDLETGVSVQDWATTFADAGALWVANTGYGYGDTNQVAYSTAMMADFSGDITEPITIGEALAEAAQQYAAGNVLLSPYDIKSMMESTLYGMPMYSLDLSTPTSGLHEALAPQMRSASASASSAAALASATHTAASRSATMTDRPRLAPRASAAVRALRSSELQPHLGGAAPQLSDDPGTGLPEQSETVTLPVQSSSNPSPPAPYLTEQPGGNDTSYYESTSGQVVGGSLIGSTQTTEFRPIEPLTSLNVTEAGLVAHGALITALSSQDQPIDPTVSQPDVDTSETPPSAGSAAFPGALQRVAQTPGFGSSGAGSTAQLDLVDGQFVPDPATPGDGTQRLFTSTTAEVLYTEPGVQASDLVGDFTPPTIETTSGQVSTGGSVQFAVTAAAGESYAPVKEVVVLYTDAAHPGSWSEVLLSQSSGVWSGTGSVTAGDNVTFFVEAVDAAGNVAMSNNNGTFFGSSVTSPVQIVLSGTQGSGGVYTSAVSAQVSLEGGARAPTYTLTSGSTTIVTGQPLPSGGDVTEGTNGSYTLEVSATGALGSPVSTSVSFTVDIPSPVTSAATTSTALSSSSNPSVYGTKVTFTAVVTPTPDAGTVKFSEGSTVLGSVPLVGGEATVATTALAVGTDPVVASYEGDGSFATSTSNTVEQVVDQASTTTTLTASADPSPVGQKVTFTASVVADNGVGTPSGTVSFANGGTAISGCSSVTISTGSATCSYTFTSTGTYLITASHGGAGSSNGSLTEYVDTNLSSYHSLSGINLSGAYLVMANLKGDDLQGDDLQGADLAGADLVGTGLQLDNLSGADLVGADAAGANLGGDNLTGANASGADLAGAVLQLDNWSGGDLAYADLAGANLQLSDLNGVNLTGANLLQASITGAILSGANLSGADLAGDTLTLVDLVGANLTGTDFAGGSLNLADLQGAAASGANLSSTNLQGADLQGVNLSGGNLQGASGQGVILSDANLSGVNAANANLKGANLTGANLTSATLTSANLSSANLTGAKLTSANLTNADLQSANLTNATLAMAITAGANLTSVTWSNTVCPDGTNSNNDQRTCIAHLTP